MKPNVTGKKALSIDEFCEAHDISHAFYYKLKAAGKGPVEMEGDGRALHHSQRALWHEG